MEQLGHFRRVDVLEGGDRVRTGPGATVRAVNARLARHGRKLGPDLIRTVHGIGYSLDTRGIL